MCSCSLLEIKRPRRWGTTLISFQWTERVHQSQFTSLVTVVWLVMVGVLVDVLLSTLSSVELNRTTTTVTVMMGWAAALTFLPFTVNSVPPLHQDMYRSFRTPASAIKRAHLLISLNITLFHSHIDKHVNAQSRSKSGDWNDKVLIVFSTGKFICSVVLQNCMFTNDQYKKRIITFYIGLTFTNYADNHE